MLESFSFQARSWLFSRHAGLLALLASTLIVALLCGRSVLRFSSLLHNPVGVVIAAPAARPPAVMPSLAAVGALNWFGASNAPAPASGEGLGSAALGAQLELRGLSHAGGQGTLDGAYIGEQGKPEKFYRPGQELDGNMGRLQSVFADHVAIQNAQGTQSLYFPSADTAAPAETPARTPADMTTGDTGGPQVSPLSPTDANSSEAERLNKLYQSGP